MSDPNQAPDPNTIFSSFAPNAPAVETGEKAPRQKRRRVSRPAVEKAPVKRRKRRAKVAEVNEVRTPPTVQMPIAQIITACAGLKAEDAPVFEKLLGLLNAAGQGQRQRVLGALSKLFA